MVNQGERAEKKTTRREKEDMFEIRHASAEYVYLDRLSLIRTHMGTHARMEQEVNRFIILQGGYQRLRMIFRSLSSSSEIPPFFSLPA